MNRIDPTSTVRVSTNTTTERQTPKSDFGDRIRNGLQTVAGLVQQGASVAAPLVPGGAIVSAAVSSLSSMGDQMASNPGAATVPYASAATGVVSLGSGSGAAAANGGGSVGGLSAGGVGNTMTGGGSAASNAMSNTGTQSMAGEMGRMLEVQMQMHRENQVFSTVSNVLKTRHDTVKNSISNVR